MTMLSRRRFAYSPEVEGSADEDKFIVRNTFREQLPSAIGRDGLYVDLTPPYARDSFLRVANVHLESRDTFFYREQQLQKLARALYEPGCSGGLIAGDFNSITEEDHQLIEWNSLKDAWLTLYGNTKPGAPAAAAEGSSSRRSQPARQTRTNPPRVSNLRGPLGGRDSVPGGAASDQPIDIYPAITFFADAMTALPKELVRHFTLLKEVDAKIYGPEDALFQLVDAAMNTPAPEQPRQNTNAIEASAPESAAMSAQNSSTGVVAPGQAPTTAPSTNGSQAPSAAASATDPRRQLYQQTAFKIQEMLGSLEEKNHVISTANEALQKQLARIDDVWPHLENEFSDEAKWGSTTHWAYPENRAGNKAAHAERSRREGAAAISAAAQQLAEEAAARSDARKQAVQAKKNLKAQNQENEPDDAEGRGKTETTKKSIAKARKAADAAAAASGGSNVGLGITNGATNGAAPQPKRRKVEKTAAKDAPVERAMASVFGPEAPKAKTSSPRGTPAPDGPKKRKALPTGSGQTKKRTGPTNSPSAASSPVIGAFPEPKLARASPIPPIPKPPTAARARNNSVASAAENGKARPSSSASSKPNGIPQPAPELPQQPPTWPKPVVEPKGPNKETPVPIKPEPPRKEAEPAEAGAVASAVAAKKDTPKLEEPERRVETPIPPPIIASAAMSAPPPVVSTPATVTKSGRASKPSTPALATFQEAQQQQRSRTARNESKEGAKRKKAATVATHAQAAKVAEEDTNSSMQDDDEEDGGDLEVNEPLYCYCNGVSYGEMVACDADNCKREWFHLDCVGLKVAPKGNAKWYCEPCKKQLAINARKLNGR
ncbi:hypothetical protein F5X68DRAFT_236918 [Plectosphaerella plurivora]|uniref:Chromatin modification-related protein n=1 Tax=Plectosphaerella plurivora TaxID=936078 RepID=A0A9P8V1T8_9PEZI|nr:hypothetical protein F5X68DRAFT_236918 [Plectosphaerella plurivora]